ncbi:MAG: DUF6448 family protein [Armatimonadia bacterium]
MGKAMLFSLVILVGAPALALAHCDTMDGPVVAEARQALTKGDVTPLLKWVRAEDEATIREIFEKTLAVRKLGPEARDLADMYLFETLVRIHRAGEGAPYTGLKPAGTPIDPAVAAADTALQSGSDEALTKIICQEAQAGLHRRFTRARETREHAGHSIEAGREYVEAYVDFTHYAEALYKLAAETAGAHGEAPAAIHEH